MAGSHTLYRNAIMQLFPIIDEILTLLSVHGTNNCHRETVSMVGARLGNFDRRIDSNLLEIEIELFLSTFFRVNL